MQSTGHGRPAGQGGASGKRWEPVTRYMVPLARLVTVDAEQPIETVIDILLQHGISGAPVTTSQRRLLGIISEKDCLRIIVDHVYHNLPMSSRRVADYMSTQVQTLSQDADVVVAADTFLASSVRRLPVVDAEGLLIGQVSRRDILRAARAMQATTW